MQTTTRNATLQDLAELLRSQQVNKVDVVAPARAIRSEGGVLVINGTSPEITLDGVTATDGRYTPTVVCDEGLATKLSIPTGYLKRLREERPDLYDANVNGWLHGCYAHHHPEGGAADPRSFLVRCFRGGDEGGTGIARAFLSDSYKVIDHLDVLTAALDGIRQAGKQVEVEACDLTERRMYVRILAPEIKAYAHRILERYRSPFGERLGRDHPIVFAGLVIANSEVGQGACTLTPRIVWEVCGNGQTFAADALRSVHLGQKMDEGVIRWSDETLQRNLALVTSQTRDAVRTFLDVEYVTHKLDEIEALAVRELPGGQAAEVVRNVGASLRFTPDQIDGVLDHFIRGGDVTAGGVMQAVTAYARVVEDADVAHDIEAMGGRALELAAAAAR